MIRKYVSRLLALSLVLCMVVTCLPLRAQAAVSLTRPENITDEEWEVLRKKLLAQLAAEQAEELEAEQAAALAAGEALSADSGNEVTDNSGSDAAKDQPGDVQLPPQADAPKSEQPDAGSGAEDAAEPEVSGEDTQAPAKAPEEAGADEPPASQQAGADEQNQPTDITYNVSSDDPAVKTEQEGTVKVEASAAAETVEGTPAPKPETSSRKKVELSIGDMNAKQITRVTRTKDPAAPDADTDEAEPEVEYFYNAANGTEDTQKKYFTIEERETEQKDIDGNVIGTVKEKVVSLWTSFLGIFHITTDAFEGSTKDENGVIKTYSDLSEAAADNTGKTVEMLRDYETKGTAEISNGVTVDLNGHEYTNSSESAAISVSGTGSTITIENGSVVSDGDGIEVEGSGSKFSLKNLFLRSNDDKDSNSKDAGLRVGGSDNKVTVDGTTIDGSASRYGIQFTGGGTKDTLTIKNSDVVGGTGVEISDANANISGSYLAGTGKTAKCSTSGAALAVTDNGKSNHVIIDSGLFDSAGDIENIYATGKNAVGSIAVNGGRFSDPDDLYLYITNGHALICHNDGTYFTYEVVGTDYTPTRDGYRFLGYTDADGNAITLAEAYRKGAVAYAQWKAIPETTAQSPLITVKTDEKGCTTKVTVKGDTAYVTVKDAEGEFAPISEVTIPSVKRLQDQDIDTVEIQVDEDVTLVLDIEKAEDNGFTDTVEVTLDKDTLLITSGKETCIELDIEVLKASDKPVEIQLVEGELTVMLGKKSSLTVDLSKALETGERIVVKLETGVLKLYDKYNKPLEED